MSVSVVIGNYQGAAFLDDCLTSLAQQTRLPDEGVELGAQLQVLAIVLVGRADLHSARSLQVLPKGVVEPLCACGLGVTRGRYLAVMAAARLPRYVAIAYLGAQLGGNANAWLRSHLWHMGGLAVALLAGIYLLLKLADKQNTATR